MFPTVLASVPLDPRVAGRRRTVLGRLAHALAVSRERSRLSRLDDRMLADIGRSRAEAAREAERPVWDAPMHWRRND
ncbi:MAG: DUF1127 domain-containing protein [Rhodobacteraceae bacterium]|nr:DUF1127 domain-containing protein [Paracoccaceae bacterium]